MSGKKRGGEGREWEGRKGGLNLRDEDGKETKKKGREGRSLPYQ